MPQPPARTLPQRSRLSIQEAVHQFADAFGLGRLRPEAIAAVHEGLSAGTLKASGNLENLRDGKVASAFAVPKEYWEAMSGDQFLKCYSNSWFEYIETSGASSKAPPIWGPISIRRSEQKTLTKVTLAAGEVDSWIASLRRSVAPTRTGAPGRPSSAHLVLEEMKRLHERGELPSTLAETARVLERWLKANNPSAPPMKAHSIENTIREDWRALTKGK